MSESQETAAVPEKGNLGRRDMLKLAGALAGATGLAQFISITTVARRNKAEVPEGGPKWGMLIDINKCIGCNYCTYACQATNNLADDMLYNVVTTETTQNNTEYFLSRPCMQCEEAPCVHVCPVAATYYRADGIVEMDYNKCIGCRYCQVACPYDARRFNWEARSDENPYIPTWGQAEVKRRPRGVVEKCTFCIHRIDAGLRSGLMPGIDAEATPACVNACPVGARIFGNLSDPGSPVSQYISSHTTLRLREDLGTEANVYYVPPKEGL